MIVVARGRAWGSARRRRPRPVEPRSWSRFDPSRRAGARRAPTGGPRCRCPVRTGRRRPARIAAPFDHLGLVAVLEVAAADAVELAATPPAAPRWRRPARASSPRCPKCLRACSTSAPPVTWRCRLVGIPPGMSALATMPSAAQRAVPRRRTARWPSWTARRRRHGSYVAALVVDVVEDHRRAQVPGGADETIRAPPAAASASCRPSASAKWPRWLVANCISSPAA